MKIKYEVEKSESGFLLLAKDDGKTFGRAKALTDGYDWAMIYDIEADDEEIEKGLVQNLVSKLEGQEIFMVSALDKLSFYESLGFRRSKNAFTFFGEDLSLEQEKELTKSGLYLPIGFQYETEFEPFAGTFPVGRKSGKKDITVSYLSEPDGIDYEQVNALLEKAFGSKRDIAVTKDTFLHSQYVQYAFDGEKLIGCARAVSDGNHALILNVAVDPEYQGLHLGWNVVVKLAHQMEGQTIFLNTHPGGVGFYNRKGFRRNKTAFLYPAHEMPHEIEKGFSTPVGYRFPDEYELFDS
ncbi:MAG: GNAT family N-acetyltransferase [Lachnospiraceae bacterium]